MIKKTLSLVGVSSTPETVDTILSGFTTLVTKLKATQQFQLQRGNNLRAEAVVLQGQAVLAHQEAERAASAIEKIEALLA